ncbi:TMEM175 family protein [Acidiphilium sp.]|uniref:TMEM175 family protein n=1 Tax=Acidiphilium sp. TaxID=527 RepID=UPI003D020F6C
MEKDRLAAFTDGVIAVIITIMVLDLKLPHGTTLAALATAAPTFVSYILSFIYVAIYWNNHHHFFQLVPRVTGSILWANLHLLFWLSLIPFATAWVGAHHTAPIPTALYGVALLLPALAWYALQTAIIRTQGKTSALAKALGRDIKGKVSPLLYLGGIGLAFIDTALSDALYAIVALLWLIPDRRVEAAISA